MKFNPRFYAVRNSKELQIIEKGLERLSKILDVEANSFPGGMGISVWNRETGSEVYPSTHQIDNWIVNAEGPDSKDRDKCPVHSYINKRGEYIRITLGDKTGRKESFNFHYKPISPEEFEVFEKSITEERIRS